MIAKYELFLTQKNKKKINHNKIVFIDDVVEESFDYKLNRMVDKKRNKEIYWNTLNNFLEFVQKNLFRSSNCFTP